MSLFLQAVWGGPYPTKVAKGGDILLHFEVPRFGSAVDEIVEDVRISVYRLASDNSKVYVLDRDGNTLNNHLVASSISAALVLFRVKTRSDAIGGPYFAEWTGKFRGQTLPVTMDRFALEESLTTTGDIVIEGAFPPSV